MESAAVEEDEVAGLSIDLHAVGEWSLALVILWHQIPILLETGHLLLLKVSAVVVVGLRHHHKPSLLLPRVG
jgi:hypothetical protein